MQSYKFLQNAKFRFRLLMKIKFVKMQKILINMKCSSLKLEGGKKVRHPGLEDHQVDVPLGRVLQGGGQEEEVQCWTTTLNICQLFNLSLPSCYFCLQFTINM